MYGLTGKSFLLVLPLLLLVYHLPSTYCNPAAFASLPSKHLNYNETVQYLHRLKARYPHLVTLQSIGKSVQGRDLWVVRLSTTTTTTDSAISRNATASELDFASALTYYLHKRAPLKPTVRLVGAIHGDEALGNYLLLRLAEYYARNAASDHKIAQLLNTTDIELLPLMNPDGYTVAKEGDCHGVRSKLHWNGRENANGKDLEENFMSNFENGEAAEKKLLEPETLAVMTWMVSNPSFVLSATIHTGSLVVSYPLDGQKAITPDDSLFRQLARNYVQSYGSVDTFVKGCTANEDFEEGLVIGNKWNVISNSMADFAYLNTNSLELNLHLACCKYPNASELTGEWEKNQPAFWQFIKSAHFGIKGIISDAASKSSIKGATVSVAGINHNVTTSELGEYWRLLLPGTYSVTASAYGYQNVTKTVTVTNTKAFEAAIVNFELSQNLEVHETEEAGEFPEFHTPTEFVHHNYESLKRMLTELTTKYPHITRLYSAGQSVENRELYVLEITDNPGVHEMGEPEFKYVANMHGNEVVGREMVLLMAKLLLENYGKDGNITRLVDETRIHLMPSMNPDGWERSTVGDCDSLDGRGNAHNIDLNRNFPDQYKTYGENRAQENETLAIMSWLKSYPFVLSANLHGGSLVANYPYDGNDHTDGSDGYSKTPDDGLFRHLAEVYSSNHPTMSLGECQDKCSPEISLMNEHFDKGIINGAEWYALYGGMQDWNYLHTNCFEITVEMGCRKYPNASQLPKFWRDNRRSMLTFIGEVHKGIKGVIRDAFTNMSLAEARITVSGINHSVTSVPPYGDYWRLLLPGTYKVTASKLGYQPLSKTITVPEASGAVTLDFTLQRLAPSFLPGPDSNTFVIMFLCLLIFLVLGTFIVLVCCPGISQQIEYLWASKRKGARSKGGLLGVVCCCGGKRSPVKPIESFHYTKLNASDTAHLYESEDEEEDLAFDVNHLLRK